VINLKAEPSLLDGEILLTGSRGKDFEIHARKLSKMLAHCKPGVCRSYVLVIPHCVQVAARYLDNFKRLGATFSDEVAILQNDYPYIKRLVGKLRMHNNTTVLNALPALRSLEESGRYAYLQNDPHLTAEGQQVISDVLAQQLEQLVGFNPSNGKVQTRFNAAAREGHGRK
jgi:hypothetical protein